MSLPDALLLATIHVRASPRMTALVGPRVYANEVPASVTFPCTRLRNITTTEIGTEGFAHVERVQVDNWGAARWSWEQARLIAVTAREVLGTLQGVYTAGTITDVRLVAGLSSFVDPDVDKAGYRFDVAITAHQRQYQQ